MKNRIDTVTARNQLQVRREPYWHKIDKGTRVGFRKMSKDSAGSWQFRHRHQTGDETQRSLGSLEDYPPNERFDQAVAAARAWISSMTTPDSRMRQRVTVIDACDAYVAFVRERKGDKPADDLAYRYRRWVRPSPISSIELTALTREHVNDFRRTLVATPVRVNIAGDTRPRSKDTANRDLAALRVALNHALSDQLVASDFAWREPLKAYKNVARRRNLYLDREQRRALIAHAAPDLAFFLWGLSILPLRPGPLSELTTEDFDSRLGILKIGKDKGGHERTIKLPPEVATPLANASTGRPANAPLLARADGLAWNKDSWKGPIKDAARLAGLPLNATAYTLRHSVITDLVHGGLDLLTVAQISGTSVAMIEKHYGHLRSEIAALALSKLAL